MAYAVTFARRRGGLPKRTPSAKRGGIASDAELSEEKSDCIRE
jgi:hypothetical protein